VWRVNGGIRVFSNFESAEDADDQFYARLTPEERLDILLELTERERSSLGEAAERFERVHRIVELSQR
jgi:WSTF/HB1/Itc1p/MBD9 motif protein